MAGVVAVTAGPATAEDGGTPPTAGEGPRVVGEVPVTAMDRSVRPANNSPQLVAHPDDDDFLVLANRLDAPGFGCALHVSGDGGDSWWPVQAVTELPEGAHSCYAPKAAFGPDGVLHVVFAALSGEGNTPMGIFHVSSTDLGRTFSAPREVLGEFRFGVDLAVDHSAGSAGRLHLVWVQAGAEVTIGAFGPPPNPVMAAYSDDGGQSWSQPVQVSDADRDRVVGPNVAVGPAGQVHVVYYDLLGDVRDYQGLEGPVWDGVWEIVSATSTDGGESFGPGVIVDDAVEPHERVMVVFTMPPAALAADDRGRVCVAWADARFGAGDVLARCRPPGSASFEPAVRVNDNPPDDDTVQWLPQLAFAPNGRLDAMFYDQRRSTGDEHVHQDVFSTYSTDGGRSFAANTRVTSRLSFTEIGQRYDIPSAAGMYEFGGRLGLHATDTEAVAAWADTRNSRPHTHAQDVFAAHVTGLPGGGGGVPAGLVAAGAVVIVLCGGFLVVAARRPRRGMADEEGAAAREPADAPAAR